ncbi:MAG: FtsX-like permease family protein [Flavisolibacter sp.]
MFKSYLTIAWRNLMKNKLFSFINIFGLATGFTCCMLISLYIFQETHYDIYHKNINRLYQLGTTFIKDGKGDRTPNTPAPMAAAMQQEYPEIEKTTRLMGLFAEDKTLLQYKPDNGTSKSFYETRGFMADSTFFNLFTYDFIEGDPLTCLNRPNTVVLNEDIARKFFGNSPALNKILHISSNSNGDTDFVVTGVFRPMKKPSQIDAHFFLSLRGGNIEQFMRHQTDMVGNNMFHTFFLLKPGADANKLEAKFPAFVDKYLGKPLQFAGFQKKQFLIPVRDLHLHAGMDVDITPVGSTTYLYILASIALFALLIACINFMNLSTARSSKRSTEVGIRKVLGAQRNSLMQQFLGESLLLSFAALVIGLVLSKLLLPGFSYMSGRELSFDFSEHWPLAVGFFLLSILTGFVAGSYPAFYLSSFQPVRVLKGKFTGSFSAVALRKGLVVFQFVISVVLIIASVIISKQMTYMRSTDLAFAKDQQIIIPLRSGASKNIYKPLKNELRNNPYVQQVGASMFYPGILNPSDMGLRRQEQPSQEAKLVHTNVVDESGIQTLGIKLIAGRLFSEEFPGDTNNRMVLNESAIKQIGFTSAESAVGANVYFDWRGQTYSYTIIGVTNDFHFQDLHVPIAPYGFFLNNVPSYNYLIVHAKSSNVAPLLSQIESKWKLLNPNEPFEYSFLDEDFAKNYEAENRLSAMVRFFTIIAILISCLGLFGLATFSAEQRTKEIGIRKVLGASVSSIVSLLSKDFLKLVGIAILLASPIGWYVMNKWLQDFAYRIPIGWEMFGVAAFLALLIAFLTIGFQAVRTANSNPVKSLRTE